MKDEYIIKVKRAVGTPASLADGEPVYLHVSQGYFAQNPTAVFKGGVSYEPESLTRMAA